jgi:SAM-dependent methyltransferase
MDDNLTHLDPSSWHADEIGENGERVSHLRQDHVYFGHLSIYHFARRFCPGAAVLDIGSGAGYGADYLAEAGARNVLGTDVSERAIAFSRHHFQRPNLEFEVVSAEEVSTLAPRVFDLVFSSNTLEHVPNVQSTLRGCWRVLEPDGLLLLAVPPITDDHLLYLNLINPYHLNLWSPRQWCAALGQFFDEVTPHLHGVGSIGEDFRPDQQGLAVDTGLSVDTFVIEPGSVEEMYNRFTLTAIILATGPRPESDVPPAGMPLIFVDDSFTRRPGYISPRLRRKLRRYFDPPATRRSLAHRARLLLQERGVWWRHEKGQQA